MKREETRHHVAVSHHFLIEMDEAIGIHKQTEAVLRIRRRHRLSRRDHRRQVHANALHVHLAQAHHHETSQEEEHDIDQRNDFYAGPFFWNWRSDLHTGGDRLELGA